MNSDQRIVNKMIAVSAPTGARFRGIISSLANDRRTQQIGLARCLDALADVGFDEDLDAFASELQAAGIGDLHATAAALRTLARNLKARDTTGELTALFEAAIRVTCRIRDERLSTGGAA